MEKKAINKEIFELFNEAEKKIAVLYYGINTDKLNDKEIAEKLRLSSSYVDFMIENIKDKVNKYYLEKKTNVEYTPKRQKKDDFYQVEKIDDETSKLIFQMSEAFFSLFRGTEPVLVEEYLKVLPKKDRNIVALFYGLDGINCLDYDQICSKFHLSEDSVDKILENSIKKVKACIAKGKKINVIESHGENGYVKENKYLSLIEKYGEERVNEIYVTLADREKDMISLFYGKEPKTSREVGEKYGMSPTKAYSVMVDIIKKIELILRYDEVRQTESEFYKKFEGHEKDEIDGILKQILYAKKLEIVKFFYGIDCTPKSISDLASMYGYNEQEIVGILEEVVNKINRKLVLLSNIDTSRFYKKFEGYTKEEVDTVIAKLSDKDRDIISLCFGLEGQKMSKGQISNKYSTGVKDINDSITRIVGNIRRLLNNPKAFIRADNKEEKIVKNDLSLIEIYGKDEVVKAISMLDEFKQKVMKVYLGIEGECLTVKEISDKYKIMPNAIYQLIRTSSNKIKRIIANSSIEEYQDIDNKENKYEELISKYGAEKVEQSLGILNERTKEFIVLHYGINCESIPQKEISLKYGIACSVVSRAIKNGLAKMENYIVNPEKYMPKEKKVIEKSSKYDELVSKYGKETVDSSISRLNDRDQEILKLHFGVNCETVTNGDLSEMFGLSYNGICFIIRNSIQKVENFIINPEKYAPREKVARRVREKNSKYDEWINKYGKEKVDSCISLLKNRDQEILKLYFGIDCEKVTNKVISERFSLSYNNVGVIVKKKY